ncbi:nicotinate-nucleotide adenylyltransferase [Halobacillus salinus]|uniref:Probable nicotinate-nucleotide adenylyltransferase n=1 Tax=Halobacillus salinus TaxID=192814 RepID=A0A4Z0H335_9BACI|nr:nicotinate-nucleotide adenylyltransferase [Halobacillus salinus]TGB04237.1 nicotinate-nucleotide adenylyltransferase [Halobacillus salinus]
MKRIGILGGTFDPPHLGHLIMAECAYEGMELDEVWFLPSHIPPHKQKATVSSEDRLAMVKKAIENNPHFSICDVELTRKGTSYTVDTMKLLKEEYQGHQFYFIIGGDMVEHLPKWNRIEELKEYVEFIGMQRPGFQWEQDQSDSVHEVNIPLIEISSSVIREKLAKQESVRYLTPDAVIDYIKEHQLYEPNS